MADETIPRVSIVDNVTERLRTDLLTGEIQPGERIRVGVLEKRFGVSHIPIREAVRRLESEGLIVTLHQRTPVATEVTMDDLAGLYDLRRLIEGQVAARSALKMTDEDVVAVEIALEELENAAADPTSPKFWSQHNEFHWAILSPGGTPWIRKTLDQLWFAAERYVRLFVTTFGSFEKAMEQHRAIVGACRKHDDQLIVELLLNHLTQTETTVAEGFMRVREHSDSHEDDKHS